MIAWHARVNAYSDRLPIGGGAGVAVYQKGVQSTSFVAAGSLMQAR